MLAWGARLAWLTRTTRRRTASEARAKACLVRVRVKVKVKVRVKVKVGVRARCEGVHDEEVVEVDVARVRGGLVLPPHLRRQRARTARDEQRKLGEDQLTRCDVPQRL